MQRTAILNVVGLSPRHLGEHTPNIRQFCEASGNSTHLIEPCFPAVTATAQSTYLTGHAPTQHGIVANGWYDREYAEHRFWKQSNHLVSAPKLWDMLRQEDPGFTCAKLFWWFNMYSTVDFSVTPRPVYLANGRKIFDIQTHPMGHREKLKNQLGDFPFQNFWGPNSNIESSRWIAQCAMWIEEFEWPSLSLVYLPHLDYNLQRLGPHDPDIVQDLHEIDLVVGELIRFYEARSIKVVLLSEYGITEVDHPIHLNRIFREKGWLQIKNDLGMEYLDLGGSKVFAVADHQVAHIYLNDPSIKDEVRKTLERVEGVEYILGDYEKLTVGIDHPRSGDFIVVSNARSWFTYYYWFEDDKAPDFARCVDIHRKCGYDPVELFLDPAIKHPKLALGKRLIQSKLNFRTNFDVIPLDATLVRGSHGRLPEDRADWPVLIGNFPETPPVIDSRHVCEQLRLHCLGKTSGYAPMTW